MTIAPNSTGIEQGGRGAALQRPVGAGSLVARDVRIEEGLQAVTLEPCHAYSPYRSQKEQRALLHHYEVRKT